MFRKPIKSNEEIYEYGLALNGVNRLYGNCFFGALALSVFYKQNIQWFFPKNTWVPHFYINHEGRKLHFQITRYLLSNRINFLWFEGRYSQILEQDFTRQISSY